MDGSWVQNIPVKYIYWAASGMATILAAGFSWIVTVTAKTIKKDRKKLSDIGPKLDLIMENHLRHIQEACEKVADKQDQTNVELATQTGVLQTIAKLLVKEV